MLQGLPESRRSAEVVIVGVTCIVLMLVIVGYLIVTLFHIGGAASLDSVTVLLLLLAGLGLMGCVFWVRIRAEARIRAQAAGANLAQ